MPSAQRAAKLVLAVADCVAQCTRDPKGFEKYVRETSVLIPLPPSLYRGIPLLVKQVLLFEWPIYARDASGKLKGLEPAPARPHTPLVVDSGADSPHSGNKA